MNLSSIFGFEDADVVAASEGGVWSHTIGVDEASTQEMFGMEIESEDMGRSKSSRV